MSHGIEILRIHWGVFAEIWFSDDDRCAERVQVIEDIVSGDCLTFMYVID
ncbi:MAG: hypothetical protein ACKO85_02375 [Isosphaeraceae bacterium]